MNIKGKKEQLVIQFIDERDLEKLKNLKTNTVPKSDKSQNANKVTARSYQIDTTKWNPLHFSILYDQLPYVRYFLEQNEEPWSFAFMNPE